MSARDILTDNAEIKNSSFLYYLRNQSDFNINAFKELYSAIRLLADDEVEISRTAQQINYIYGEILKCILYHFDPDDEFRINNLPGNYSKLIEYLDKSVDYYFQTRI